MKKTVFSLLVIVFLSTITTIAQNSLTLETSLPRDSDEIIKQQISFCSPGKAGTNITWDFRDSKFLNEVQCTYYKGNWDSIFCMQQCGTIYKYKLSKDSLLFLGYENPTTQIKFTTPAPPILRYPFNYGDTLTTSFIGSGGYSHIYALRAYGKIRTTIDATGILLLPDCDTLHNVMRLHRREIIGQQLSPSGFFDQCLDSLNIDRKLQNDSVTWQVDTYQWYLPGYRYPVLESIENTITQKEVPKRHFCQSTLFLPEAQEILESDTENNYIREQTYFLQESVHSKEITSPENKLSDKFSISCQIDPINHIISIQYNLYQNTTVEILLASISGMVLYHEPPQTKSSGFYSSEVSFDQLPGNEFILTAIIDDKCKSWKIKK